MKSNTGAVLIHGYTGSANDLRPLDAALALVLGRESVTTVCLPRHGGVQGTPSFDPDDFVNEIERCVRGVLLTREEFILIGHSTGGVLALSLIEKTGLIPRLLVLLATPRTVDTSSLSRWESCSDAAAGVSFTSFARLTSFINKIASRRPVHPFPVLMLYADRDELVPVSPPYSWCESDFPGPTRRVVIPETGHDVLNQPGGNLAIDIILRTVRDTTDVLEEKETETLERLKDMEPETERMVAQWPPSVTHLIRCPSTDITAARKSRLEPIVPWEPVFANIEISTRCNLSCTYCARQWVGSDDILMSQELFDHVLSIVPSAYRITLVGLGEPLLHPGVSDLVASAYRSGRRVGLVTNAMYLDKRLTDDLLAAGLRSIAFSIDARSQALASTLRPGTDMEQVAVNIRTFMAAVCKHPDVSTAIFCALSSRSLVEVESIVDLACDLGVHALMLTDLNFAENEADSLWKNATAENRSRVRKAVLKALEKKLPVLSVHGLESFGLFHQYRDFLLIPPDALYSRSSRRIHCVSPWQTLVVTAEGKAGVCDCQPSKVAGDLYTEPFSKIWNGEAMVGHRKAMLGSSPPAECTTCPRF